MLLFVSLATAEVTSGLNSGRAKHILVLRTKRNDVVQDRHATNETSLWLDDHATGQNNRSRIRRSFDSTACGNSVP